MKTYLVCLLPVILLFLCYDCQDLRIDPFQIAVVTIGKPLTFTCIYTGNNTPVFVRWFLGNDTIGMIVSKSTCMRIGTPGTEYEVSRYAINCSQLTITNISENDIGDQWGCTVDFTIGTSPNVSSTMIRKADPTTIPTPSTTTSTTTTVTSSSTSISSTTSIVTIHNTSTNPTSVSSTSVSPANNTNNISTSSKPTISESTTINITTSNKSTSDSDIKVIVPAVVVPCGLLIIGGIILVVCCVRRRARRNVRESPDGMAVQDKGNNIDEWKQSQGYGKATDNLDAVYTIPDGYIIYPGPAAMYTARSYKDKKHHGVTDQQASHLMATSRPAYGQTAYYPHAGHYGQSSQGVYYSGGGEYSYGQRSMSHHDHSGRKQQKEYYNQFEMADYGGNRAGYRHSKQETAIYY